MLKYQNIASYFFSLEIISQRNKLTKASLTLIPLLQLLIDLDFSFYFFLLYGVFKHFDCNIFPCEDIVPFEHPRWWPLPKQFYDLIVILPVPFHFAHHNCQLSSNGLWDIFRKPYHIIIRTYWNLNLSNNGKSFSSFECPHNLRHFHTLPRTRMECNFLLWSYLVPHHSGWPDIVFLIFMFEILYVF